MSTSQLVAFIIGGGANVGISVARKLKKEGYAVALGSRNPDQESLAQEGILPVSVDGVSPESLRNAFKLVREKLGHPNVVVYNTVFYVSPKSPSEPLSISSDDFAKSSEVEVATFVAAQEALVGFRSDIDKSSPKVFISTGNPLPFVQGSPIFLTLGSQKVVMSLMMKYCHQAYAAEGIRFHYASLVSNEGGIPNLANDAAEGFYNSGPAHADAYWELISRKEPENFDYRFTFDGKKLRGYD